MAKQRLTQVDREHIPQSAHNRQRDEVDHVIRGELQQHGPTPERLHPGGHGGLRGQVGAGGVGDQPVENPHIIAGKARVLEWQHKGRGKSTGEIHISDSS